MMKTSDFDYTLPPECIAQTPADKRECSRMMILSRRDGTTRTGLFSDILNYLHAGDVLVLNDTQVIHARLFGRKIQTEPVRGAATPGAKIQCMLLSPCSVDFSRWTAYLKPGKRVPPGSKIALFTRDESAAVPDAFLHVVDKAPDGAYTVELQTPLPPLEFIEKHGHLPLPPYITREADANDEVRYQTVYAHVPGAVAAPTAGLHFTREILQAAAAKGVEICYVTLHTGAGTFKPITVENPLDHVMHSEWFVLPAAVAETINRAKKEHRRIVAVGTTTVRVLESCAQEEGTVKPFTGETQIFLYPPYQPRIVDALLTNFHLPKSTLLMLVSTFVEREKVLAAYAQAVREHFRFYSYGDCMFLTNETLESAPRH